MNPPFKWGRYSKAADDEAETTTTSTGGGLGEGWKQCDYVGNGTRLRCKNMRRLGGLRKFCEEVIFVIFS